MEDKTLETVKELYTDKAVYLNNVANLDECAQEKAKEVEKWWQSPRWENIHRQYGPMDVVALRNSIDVVTPSHFLS